jgi:hypothetical protein
MADLPRDSHVTRNPILAAYREANAIQKAAMLMAVLLAVLAVFAPLIAPSTRPIRASSPACGRRRGSRAPGRGTCSAPMSWAAMSCHARSTGCA